MSTIDIKSVSGKTVATADLPANVFGIEPNMHVMHTVVRSQMAALRQGTASTKTRAMVSGGGRKPWRQKGTGHARQGTIRAPQWAGGGVVFGPHPRSYAFRVNNKEVKLAMRSALSAKVADGEFYVIDDFGYEQPSTKTAIATLKALGLSGRVTIIMADNDVNAYLSFRNIPQVRLLGASEINCYDFIDNTALLVTSSALKHIEEVLS
jgi:large subunit ribosomal protein L4